MKQGARIIGSSCALLIACIGEGPAPSSGADQIVIGPDSCFTFEEVNVPDGIGGELFTSWMDINEDEIIVGSYCIEADCGESAGGHYVGGVIHDRRHGTFARFTLPSPYNWVGGASINDLGEVAGQAIVFDPMFGFVEGAGFLRSPDGTVSIIEPPVGDPDVWVINDLNESGAMVGFFYDETGRARGWILDGDHYTVYDATPNPDDEGTVLSGIDDRGTVVGHVRDGELRDGFIDEGDGPVFFNPVGAERSSVGGLSSNGIVAGYSRPPGDPDAGSGFLYRDGAFATLDYPGATFDTYVLGVNAKGTAVGTYDFFSFGLIIDPVRCDP